MALGIKTTWYFSTGQGGWSESWQNVLAGSLSTAEDDARRAGLLRLAICGLGVTLIGARVSNSDAVPIVSKLVDLSGLGVGQVQIPADATITGYADTVNRSADALQSSLLVRGLSQSGARKLIWLGGIPDAIVRVNPTGPDYSTSAVWLTKYMAWRGEFQSGRWGFKARVRIGAAVQPQPIVNFVLQGGANSIIGAVVTTGGPAYNPGDKIQIRNVRVVNPAFRSPNGTSVVNSVSVAGSPTNTTTYYLNNTNGIAPANVFAYGNIRAVQFATLAVTDLQIQKQSGHKRGKPFGLFRGRRSIPKRA